MSTELQRDIEAIDDVMRDGFTEGTLTAEEHAAWQRLKPRLTPDRERVAMAMYEEAMIPGDLAWDDLSAVSRNRWLQVAGAAIAAMGETP